MSEEKLVRTKEEEIIIYTRDHNFDRSCERAYDKAVRIFGIDDSGHCADWENFPRSSSTLNVEFVSYRHIGGMGGQTMHYIFSAYMERDDSED